MPSKQLHIGDIVMAADGKDLGTVKELGDTCFRIAAPRHRDFWLSNDAVEGRDKGTAVLLYAADRLGDAFVDVLKHSGPHSHDKPPSEGGMNLLKPLLVLAGVAAVALRDKKNRDRVMSMTRDVTDTVKSRLGTKHQDEHDGAGATPSGQDYTATSSFTASSHTGPASGAEQRSSTLAPATARASAQGPANAAQLSTREQAIIAQVTGAFPGHDLLVAPVEVHTLEGHDVNTLRFTLDHAASSDVQVESLAHAATTDDDIAAEIIRDLRLQLPADAGGESGGPGSVTI